MDGGVRDAAVSGGTLLIPAFSAAHPSPLKTSERQAALAAILAMDPLSGLRSAGLLYAHFLSILIRSSFAGCTVKLDFPVDRILRTCYNLQLSAEQCLPGNDAAVSANRSLRL